MVLSFSKLNIQYLYLKNKNISSSTLPQLLILLILEKHDKLSLEKIAELLNCDIELIINDVQGLIFNPSFNPKAELNQGVILSDIDPKTKEFKGTTEISINKNFNIEQINFSTLTILVEKDYWDINGMKFNNSPRINCDNLIKSTLIRILKERIGQKTEHSWLISEVMKEIDLFKAEQKQIEENIEQLISKNLIKRNGTLYEYF